MMARSYKPDASLQKPLETPTHKPNATYPYSQIARMRLPCVYAWRRGGEWLYVGTSSRGVARFLGAHHVIGVRDPLRPGDEIAIWVSHTARDRAKLEAELIAEHQPKYNHGGLRRRRLLRPRRCKNPDCLAPFRPVRIDQLYHSDACRNSHWRKRNPRTYVPAARAQEST